MQNIMVTATIPIKRGLKVGIEHLRYRHRDRVTATIPIKRGLKVYNILITTALEVGLQLLSRLKGD